MANIDRFIWRLRKGADRRIRSGHPWVFSNELQESPKGIPSGSPIELQDVQGQFLARGYGNPSSLIAFRALTFDPGVTNPWNHEFLVQELLGCWRLRQRFGYSGSFRLCFSENDFLPGLTVDYYRTREGGQSAQVFAIQVSTAGMGVLLGDAVSLFESLTRQASSSGLTSIPWDRTAVVLRNDLAIRKLEGLESEPPAVLHGKGVVELAAAEIAIQELGSTDRQEMIYMSCNLVSGQKTGFFLDQVHNIRTIISTLAPVSGEKVRIIDLCCYVGHWSVQLASFFRRHGCPVEVTLVDVSEPALVQAQANLEKIGVKPYDIVIADPPAFIKAKKDIPTGKHAYVKLNTQAMRLARPGGVVVSCSCSGHLTEEDLLEAVRRGLQRSRRRGRGVAKGGHGPDHPMLPQFPEGFYLKMFAHMLD
jgi:23S rRNA (cytosine1962-C5)-methyltransferase